MGGEYKCVLRFQLNSGWDCQYQEETVCCALLVLQVSWQDAAVWL